MIDLSGYPRSCPTRPEKREVEGDFPRVVNVPTEPWAGHMPTGDYDNLEAVRSSDLRLGAEYSLLKMKTVREAPVDPTTEQDRGTALHAAVLEPDTKWPRYVEAVAPDWLTNRSRKKDKDEWNRLIEEYGAEYVMRADEFYGVKAQRDRILSKPTLRAMLKDGHSELTLVWPETVEIDGSEVTVWCKARLDWLTEIAGRLAVLDLKGCADARPHKFQYSIRDFRYDLQGAHYGVGAAYHKIPAKDYALLASEWTAPYDCRLYRMRQRTLVVAEAQRDILLRQIARAQLTGEWPGYPEAPETIGLPTGTEKALEQEVQLEEAAA
jgi:PDDEXK-like domain of unknown function (DUF3799)